MAQAQKLIDDAIDGIADGEPVDWDALDDQAPDDERELLRILHLLSDIGKIHHTEDQGEATAPMLQAPVSGDPMATTRDESEPWGRYRLRQRIGEGSFGSVYRAWDSQLEREIAIKILKDRDADLLREAQMLAKLDHPNVVRVLEVAEHDGRMGLCMEFVQGETLEARLQSQGTLNADEAVLVGLDVCRALSAVHAAGFVHRDIKARNVMRARDGRIVLMDFGTVRQTEQLKARGAIGMAGTPLYMAPEVLADAPASGVSDVYSVGVLLYRLVTNAYPVEGASMKELRAAHMQGRRARLSDRRSNLPTAFIQVIETALAADPGARYLTAGELFDALGNTRGDGRPSVAKRVFIGGAAILAVPLVLAFLGFLSTSVYNATVGRFAPFNRDSIQTLVVLGWRSFFVTLMAAAAISAVVAAVTFGVRLLRLWSRIDHVSRVGGEQLQRLKMKLSLDDPRVLVQAVAAVGIVALFAVIVAFSDVLGACFSHIDTDPAEKFVLLREGYSARPSLYCWLLDVLAFGMFASLVYLGRRRFRQPASAGIWVAAPLAILAVSMALRELPFRTVWQSKAPRVAVANERCYVLGESGQDWLVYCPDKAPPRNRVLSRHDPTIRTTGVIEGIFSSPDSEH
jgi:predicted Ser/Thr protein kinase